MLPRYSITKSLVNKDEYIGSKDYFLSLVWDFKSLLPLPAFDDYDGVKVINDSHIIGGSKTRFLEALIATCVETTVVAVQPKISIIGVALTELCRLYDKKLILISPTTNKGLSFYQEYCRPSCDMLFIKDMTISMVRREARMFAKKIGALFVPPDLNHPLITAMVIRTAELMEPPRSIYLAINTGVTARGIQIAWPETRVKCVAVARPIGDGEKGEAQVVSHYMYLEQRAKIRPPFSSDLHHDAKVWELLKPGDTFWNTTADMSPPLKKRGKGSKNYKLKSNGSN